MEFNFADLFESVVDAVPDREALVCGDRRLTYEQLDERATRLAHHLAGVGVEAGDHIGLYMYNGTEYVEAMLACFKIRAVPINVNYRYVENELRYLFDNADLKGLIHQQEFCPRIAAVKDELPLLKTFIVVEDSSGADYSVLGSVEYEKALSGASPERDFGPRSSTDLFIIYTGGTTGMPKGVVWRHEDLFFAGMGGGNPLGEPIAKPEELAPNAREKDVVVQFPVPPLIHGAAQLTVLIGFNWGGKIVLAPRFDPDGTWDLIEKEKVNTIMLVGDAIARPLADTLSATKDQRDVSSLFYISSAGAVLSDPVKDQLKELLPNTIVAESFGASETGFQGMESGSGRMRFVMNDRTTVLNDDLKPVEAGSGDIGRVAQKGRVPMGYYNDEEKSAETFVEADGDRWVLLGDMAMVEADGSITVLGRGTVCINSGGEKLFPEEIENAVKSHPDVYDVVIVGIPDERWGEKVAALIEVRPGATLTLESIQEHCRKLIAGYKVPRALRIVEKVERHPSGKPDYPWAKKVAAEETLEVT
ncbi:MAG TPA: acyl-CoA synthetase [Actinomycetota bacterium]|nr:acyl-CoA synthetase [Actinomycetota bacterium]